MERKRVGGRFAREHNSESDQASEAAAKSPVRRRSRHAKVIAKARRTLQEAVPEVATKLVEQAKTGNIPHMKLLLQLLGLEDGGLTPTRVGPREKTLEEVLMEQWNNEP
jgi:hypothetical protein